MAQFDKRNVETKPLSHLDTHKLPKFMPKTGSLSYLVLLAGLIPAALINSMLFAGDGPIYPTPTRSAGQKNVGPLNENAQLSCDQVISALDHIRAKVEEWGVVTISAPVAVLDETAFYVPDNIVCPEDAYTSARTDVEGSVTQTTQTGINDQLNIVATPIIAPALTAPQQGGTATQTTTSSTTLTSPAAQGTPAAAASQTPAADAAANALPSPTPAAPPSTPAGSPAPGPTNSVSESLREAEDNTMRQKIYSQLSYPKAIPGYNHVIFAIVEVSCNPGWRTKEHYIGDCSASFEYYDLARKQYLGRDERRAPSVFAVLPLVDAQTVEMANSEKDITQLAVQLATSLPLHGIKIDAKNLFQFVRQYSRDLRSRAPIPVVNSYSSGGTFGFRFSPSFQALRDPAEKNARAANVLLPTTFPALITVVVTDKDYSYLKNKYPNGEPAILTHTSTRWYLKDRPPLWQLSNRLFSPMRRDSAKMEINAAQDVSDVYRIKEQFESQSEAGAPDGVFNPVYEEMRREIIALEEKGIGRDWPISLPAHFGAWEKLAKEQRAENDAARANEAKKCVNKSDTSPKPSPTPSPTPATSNTSATSMRDLGYNALISGCGESILTPEDTPSSASVSVSLFPAILASQGLARGAHWQQTGTANGSTVAMQTSFVEGPDSRNPPLPEK